MARVLGKEPVEVGELEIEITPSDRLIMTLQGYHKVFLVVGIDLIIGGLAIPGHAPVPLKNQDGEGPENRLRQQHRFGILIA